MVIRREISIKNGKIDTLAARRFFAESRPISIARLQLIFATFGLILIALNVDVFEPDSSCKGIFKK